MARHGSTDDRLAQVPIFQGLSKKHLGKISSLMTELDLPAGNVLMQEGRTGREFIIILEGEAEVTRWARHDPRPCLMPPTGPYRPIFAVQQGEA